MMRCLLCNATLSVRLSLSDLVRLRPLSQPTICKSCRASFEEINRQHACPGCARPQKGAFLCPECTRWQENYGWHLHHQALYTYNDAMKEYMHRYKFLGDYRLRLVFQAAVKQRLRELDADLIVPIPVTETTMQTRGFNQVLGLLEGVEVAEVLHHLATDKIAQSHKTRRQRLQTPQPFVLNDPGAIRDRKILLVDDIYTTGRTLYHAAALIKKAQCREIISFSLAR